MAEAKRYAKATQLSKIASMRNSFPIEGSAILTEEIPKVVRKAANVVTNKTNLLVTAVSALVASVIVFLIRSFRFRETTLQVTKYGFLVNQGRYPSIIKEGGR
jgi:hypothetical protein